MLKLYKIIDYIKEYQPIWACEMPDGCPPEDILLPFDHTFYRLAKDISYSVDDFKSYAECSPNKNWGEQLPLAVGLSLIDDEIKAWWRTISFQMSNLKMLKI